MESSLNPLRVPKIIEKHLVVSIEILRSLSFTQILLFSKAEELIGSPYFQRRFRARNVFLRIIGLPEWLRKLAFADFSVL